MREKGFLVSRWKKEGIVINPELIHAFLSVKRENFVPEEHRDEAYRDHPLPICCGQTISQPTTIMLMLEALDVRPGDNVLEVGAGSGYNAALISKVSRLVTSTEIIPELAEFAAHNLRKAGITNALVVNTDGSVGYAKNAPYDRIIVTAACPEIPEPLLKQLKEGGIIVVPVGSAGLTQKMIVGFKRRKELEYRDMGYFSFVPLKGKYGFKSR